MTERITFRQLQKDVERLKRQTLTPEQCQKIHKQIAEMMKTDGKELQGMGYESPIEIITGQMRVTLEDNICKAVQNAGITVDREELLRALQYDRGQYQKGYEDRDKEITRCLDCVNNSGAVRGLYAGMVCCYNTGTLHRPEYYCADVKPKGSDEP